MEEGAIAAELQALSQLADKASGRDGVSRPLGIDLRGMPAQAAAARPSRAAIAGRAMPRLIA
ncbi:hypothetical protein, partial [Streptomyces sp. NPDC059656]|uniref:hypothetical protein n=1 Tax=Streptomyces sp. NPDC059656 TaxID=3346898 RepID=UPI003673D82E